MHYYKGCTSTSGFGHSGGLWFFIGLCCYEGGCEAVVHAVRYLFRDCRSHAVFLVDALNAFNSVNQQAALHNILLLCPPLAQILINTYQHPICLINPGSGCLVSTEDAT